VLDSPAAQLFMDRAAAGGYRQELTDEEAPVVAGICRQLNGLPLAIELIASRTSAYGIGGLAQQIDRLTLLWQGRRSVPRHRTLRAMLDWSYDLLSEREQAVLSALSVFTGTFTLEMAQTVVAPPDRDGLQVANVIVGLIEKSLISVSDAEEESCIDSSTPHEPMPQPNYRNEERQKQSQDGTLSTTQNDSPESRPAYSDIVI
jgi:predicted ATPase